MNLVASLNRKSPSSSFSIIARKRCPRCSRLQLEHSGALAASGRLSWLKRVVALRQKSCPGF
eukprot:7270732-Prorocentrum_lima.AAC.1